MTLTPRIVLPLLIVTPLAALAGCGSSGSTDTASTASTSTTATRQAAAKARDLQLTVVNNTATPLTAQPTEPKGSFNVAPSTDAKDVAAGASETFHFDVPSWYGEGDGHDGALRNPGPRFTLVLTQGEDTTTVPLRVAFSPGPVCDMCLPSWHVLSWAVGETSGMGCGKPPAFTLGAVDVRVKCNGQKNPTTVTAA